MRAVGFHSEPAQSTTASSNVPDSGQGNEDVFDSQARLHPRVEIELYCQRNSHQLIRWFEPDGDERPHDYDARHDRYRQMIASFTGANAKLALVLVPDASHIAEDLETLVTRLLELERLGTEVRCTDPDRPDALQSGELLLGLGGRSPQRQAKIREAIVAKASRGEVLGRTPYGYEAGSDGLLKPVEGEAETVKEIFETYAGPWHAEDSKPLGGPGFRAIARSLNDRGLLTRTGRPWSALAISGILKNRTYLGTYTRYGVRIGGSHEPLIDREIFNRAETVTKNRKPVRRRSTEPPYLLGGIARCDLCGRGLSGLTRRRAWKRTDGSSTSKSYRYYECPSRDARKERSGEVSRHSSWHADELESAVLQQIQGWGVRIKNKLRPVVGDSSAEEILESERDFNRMVRLVASAYGTLNDLAKPLKRLEQARSSDSSEDNSKQIDIEKLLAEVQGEDTGVSKLAAGALLERVIASEDQVEVIPRT
ncbi:recombinase family protein [Dehalococcoides mccartyi]|nr:recombinase family protein [Dehalococcoides mccartyi]